MQRAISLSAEVHAPAATAESLIRTCGDVIFDATPRRPTPAGEYLSELRAEDGKGGSVAEEIRIRVEPAYSIDGEGVRRWRIWWTPQSHRRLLPAFEGELAITSIDDTTELSLRGYYRPPLGPVGRVFDQLRGHVIACESLERFLDGIAQRIDRQAATSTPRALSAAEYAEDFRMRYDITTPSGVR